MSKNIWFTSDLHLGHKNILKLSNRPFGEIDHHDDTIINNYNKFVKDGSICYILGDIAWSQSYENYKNIFSRLNGKKVIICGNHDNFKNLIRCKKEGLILDVHESKTIQIGNDRIFLSHFPYRQWNGYFQGAYHLYGHCIDDKTEILTTDGWKDFKNIRKSDKVLNLNINSGLIEEDSINKIISNNYTGNIYHFYSKGVDLRVTDEHRMITLTSGQKYKEMLAKDFVKSGKRYFIRAGEKLNSGIDLSDDMIKLLVWISADGSICNKDLVRIKLYKERKIKQIKKLLNSMQIEFRELKQKTGVSINFTLPNELKEYKFKPIDDKILQCNKHQMEIIFETYTITNGAKTTNNCVSIFTSKSEEADLLQRAFILNGFGCTLNKRINQGFESKSNKNKESYDLYVTKKSVRRLKDVRETSSVEYVENEHFWCVNTNNGTIIIRRNGKVVITGNCHCNLDDHKQSTDIGVDCWSYEPVSWEEVKKYIDENCEPNI